MSDAVFLRLTDVDVEDKPAVLESQLAALNGGYDVDEVYIVAEHAFEQIPKSPFAYWSSPYIRDAFVSFPGVQSDTRRVCFGLSTKSDFQFLRLAWEILSADTHKIWFPFAKGGSYSPFYHDVHLVIDWEFDGKRLKDFANKRTIEIFGSPSWSRWINNWDYYFRAGLTWPRRTQKGLNLRAMPAGCIFADKGPSVFVEQDDKRTLLVLLAITNSTMFKMLVELQMSFGSYEVGVIQRTPVPEELDDRLAPLAQYAHDLQRENYIHDEATHVFGLPGLVEWRGDSLATASFTLEEQASQRATDLASVQAEIDEIVFNLYGLDDEDRQLVMREMGSAVMDEEADTEPNEDDEETLPEDMPERVQNLLMWCVGVAFGRWDVRKALDRSLIPDLPGPFDPLPRCAPGALMNAEGLPAERNDVPYDYPLPIAWDGVLVDDPEQENNPASHDIVARVRGVITLLWGVQADAIEREICSVLNIRDLRDHFRHSTKGFFNFHIKRYSKSRRKAPIYWLLQSEKRGIGVWLYYPRITENTLFTTENILHTLSQREQYRLDERKSGLQELSGTDRKQREREIDTQMQLVEEIVAFHREILRLANQKLTPDHNDGVIIGIAPLHELVPWKEASKMWDKLIAGDYMWSHMSEQMKQRGLINTRKA